jgi:hypothetical protein
MADTFIDDPGLNPVFGMAEHMARVLDLEASVKFIQQNLEHCKKNHPGCDSSSLAALPKRVIYLEEAGTEITCRLVPNTHDELGRYITLSHCWGTQIDSEERTGDWISHPVTTKESLTRRAERIPWSELPRSFKDAAKIAFSLNVQYLWIDSLCIIQDDMLDWQVESAKMANIYADAFLTLAITGSPNCNGGALVKRRTLDHQRRWQDIMDPFKVETEGGFFHVRQRLIQSHDHFREKPFNSDRIKLAPLTTRAWVLQERLLSTRLVHFHAEEMLWECQTSTSCECGGLLRDELTKLSADTVSKMTSKSDFKSRYKIALEDNTDLQITLDFWLELISRYMDLLLTRETDRFIALSGLASRFGLKINSRYLAGIWACDVPRSLLWRVNPGEERRIQWFGKPIRTSSSPSWSWASLRLPDEQRSSETVPISYQHLQEFIPHKNFEVLTDDWLQGIYSAFPKASLRVRGEITQCILKHDHTPSEFKEATSGGKAYTYEHVHREHTFMSLRGFKYNDAELDFACVEMGPDHDEMLYMLPVGTSGPDTGNRYAYELILREIGSGQFERIGINKAICVGSNSSLPEAHVVDLEIV